MDDKESKPAADVTAGVRPSVLIVEDNVDTCELWSMALEATGFRVRCASSCADALAVLRSEEPIDLVVTDYWLGDGSGEALLREAVRRRAVRPGFAVICTAYRSVTSSSFAARVLHKPIATGELVAVLRELLGPEAPNVA